LEEAIGACRLSTGDILRQAVEEQTALGKGTADYLRQGQLAPDEMMLKLIGERLGRADCRGSFILDGFPRTVAQADGLERILKELGSELDFVLCLRVPNETIVRRLAGRRTCKGCGAVHHVVFSPPARPGWCDGCGGELYQREDDREEKIAARLSVYETQTTPLAEYYRKRGLLRQIDGSGNVEQVRSRAFQAVGANAA
jgi:adenylate kinase